MRILRFSQQGTDGNPSDEFFQEHLGRATASSAAKILDFTQKGMEGSTRRIYRLEKVAETLSGIACHDNYVSAPMKAGTCSEPEARKTYELEEKVMIEQVGMVVGDDERTGWSPDGVVTDDAGAIIGAIECKCPLTTTHLQTLDLVAQGLATIPEGNQPQLWFAFMVCDTLRWIDFVSRDGGMSKNPEMFGAILPRRYQQFTIRLQRSECEAQISKMREATQKFLADVDATIERINRIAPELAPLPDEPQPDALIGALTDADFEGLL